MADTQTGGEAKDKAPFMAFAADAQDVETLKAFAASRGWDDSGVQPGDIRVACKYLKEHGAPSLLVVEIGAASEASAQLDELANVCDASTKVIAIGGVNEYSFYCWLMELGLASYLLNPLTQQALDQAYAKAVEPPAAAGPPARPPGKLIAVMGTRGGVGATTLAINLAGIVADLTKKNVALVDIDPHEGSVALALDIEPSRGLRDALEKPDRIDSLFIERVMTKPMKNLSVLSAEEALHERVAVHDSAADMLLKELREKFDVVVLDVPRHLDVFGRACLKQADHAVLVTELSLLSLRDAMRQADMMRDVLKMKPAVIVANRVGQAAKQEVPLADFEKGISAKLPFRVNFAPDVFMPVSTEIAAVKMKANAAVKPVYELAAQLVPEAKLKVETVKEKKGFSLFKKKET